MRQAGEKLKGGEAAGAALTAVAPGYEQTGDHVRVTVHGKDYSEW